MGDDKKDAEKAFQNPVKSINWVTMALLTTVAVASIRGLPAMAPYGLSSIVLYVIPAIVFLIPTALVSAELASGWEGGIFGWVYAAYGGRAGMVAIWQQWIQNVVWFPVQLAFFAAAVAYIFNPSLAQNGVFVGFIIIVVYWIANLIALRGVKTFSEIGSKGLIIGTLLPVLVLVILAVIFVFTGGKTDIPVSASGFVPMWAGIGSVVLIISNFLSFAGMEMNAVHVTDMHKPAKNYPKSILMASVLILLIFIPGTLAISACLPASGIDLTTGVFQAFDVLFAHVGISWGASVMACLVVIGVLASVVTWIPGPSRGLLFVGKEGYLPPWLQRTNKAGMQENIMAVQGIIVTVLALFYALIPSVGEAFWILSAMAVQLYLIMYVMMFMTAMKLRKSAPDTKRGFKVPAMRFVASVGVIASILAFFIGFIQPSGENLNPFFYAGILLIGIIVLGSGPFILHEYKKPGWDLRPKDSAGDSPSGSEGAES
ncbi:putative glutamate/gamma-aminobutyrate antiporter [Methanomicrobium sp. W14]|uniref:amino acid permease n=1 Tax=Methanomicrobium sp. W14 TaxID=2817839 RepID=UPI001AE65B50|nr:amino acid permease [Methanomicrobium sp. W14]MBP2134197.1 putative glutamate/gamma-aminobutyrate antiporter [Methanomicrobium sp. W14]